MNDAAIIDTDGRGYAEVRVNNLRTTWRRILDADGRGYVKIRVNDDRTTWLELPSSNATKR